MKTLSITLAMSSALLAPAANAAVNYDNLAVLVWAGAAASGEPTTGDPGGTVVNSPTRPVAPTYEEAKTMVSGSPESGPDLSVVGADAVVQGNLTNPDAGTMSLSVSGLVGVLDGYQASSAAAASFEYDFTSTTPFTFQLAATTSYDDPGRSPQLTLDYLERLGPGASRYVYANGLNADQTFQSALLPAGTYEFSAELQDAAPEIFSGTATYSVQSTLDFSIQPEAVTAPVPEPASWATLIGGLAQVGAAVRRRRVRADSRPPFGWV